MLTEFGVLCSGAVGGATPTKIITTVPKGAGQTPSSQTQFIVVTTRPGGVAQAGNTYTTVRCTLFPHYSL